MNRDEVSRLVALSYADIGFILHAFQKKSKNGARNTAPGYRVNQATLARSGTDRKGDDGMSSKRCEKSSGNVLKDLGLPDALELLRQRARTLLDDIPLNNTAP